MARPPVKGERLWRHVANPDDVHAHTISAIIHNVSADDGVVTLDFDGLPSSGRPATVPWMWASFPNPGQGAWGRYMPFPGDVLKISFDYDDTPRAVGYDTKAESPETSDGKSGWPKLRRANTSGTLPMFRPLKSGEFDFMSVGGGYIYGSATGQLLLAAGPATIVLTRSTNSIQAEATQYTLVSGTNKIRYGQVRRSMPGFPGETAGNSIQPQPLAPWNPDGSLAEFQIQINKTVGTLPTSMARLAIGSVTSDSGLQELGTYVDGLRRFALEVNDPTGLLVINTTEVDVAGSMAIGSPTAPSFKLNMPSAHAELSVASMDIGIVPTGGAMEGDTFHSEMLIASLALTAALATAGSLTAPPAQIAGVITALSDWAARINSSIQRATSSTIKVQL